MSTPSQAFEGIKGNLNQIGHHLLDVKASLLPEQASSTELAYLEKINGILTNYREQFLRKSRPLYQSLQPTDLPQQLATLKTALNAHLQHLDRYEQIDGKPRQSFMTFEAGFTALANETALSAQDRLLHPQQQAMLERVPLGSTLRPGFYALTLDYQAQTIELAGAFVLTERTSPVVTDLSSMPAVGDVMLFTPTRGIETFGSLPQLNAHLQRDMDDARQRRDFMQLLPVRYHHISPGAIWPLALTPINDRPLFEHTYNALLRKRNEDIDHALNLVGNPEQSIDKVINALDNAIIASLPDLSSRLAWRAQRLLERYLCQSAPDWYRSASDTRRSELARHLAGYNTARENLLDLLNPVTTPETLARYQLLERLSSELDIHDLAPEHLVINTRRYVDPIGEYEHDRNLIDLALRGLHEGDNLTGSDFLTNTSLTYQDAPLPEAYKDLTVDWLVNLLDTLQPRLDFASVQQQMHEKPEISHAIEQMFDQRINALAYTALLQGHLSEDDFQLVQNLRQGNDTRLSAATLSLHEAQLQDMWVLRQSDANGAVIRLLLCTPEAPREQQFQAFDNETACQSHIVGWSLDNGTKHPPGTLADYLITRVALRFRAAMKRVLTGLSFKPPAQEYTVVRFGNIGSHADCLKAMSANVLATRVDDYGFSTPEWFRSTSTANRQKLLKLSKDADGAVQVYHDFPLSDARFPSFSSYLHEQAKKRLNAVLGRSQNDVDPDTVWAFSPPALIGAWTPAPLTYTELYRDGYADGVGFIDEKLSRSARFKGPKGVDLSPLTAEKVARSITGTWVGQRYINEVKTRLLNVGSADYDLRRTATLAITQRQMQRAGLECRLQGDIAGVDWAWLEHSIASMGDTAADVRSTYVIHRLLVNGEWVMGNFLFSHADFPTLLYTPNAPDGINFREARQFNYLLKKIPGMVGYFTLRVGAQSQAKVRAFLEDAKARLPEDLNKTNTSPARYDSTHRQTPLLDLRRVLYDMQQQRRIDDVEGTTVNRTQMVSGILWTCVEWVTAIATAPFPALSLSLGMLLAFKDSMLALHAYQQGDTGAAVEHLIGYVLNSAGAALTDLRPALASLKLARSPVRQVITGAAASDDTVKLIQPLQPKPLRLEDMQAVLFGGEVLWAKKAPDPIGRYLLYRLDPGTGKLVSTTRVAAPDAQGIWSRTGVTGGAPKYEKLSDTPALLKPYEIPEKYAGKMELALDPDVRAGMLSRAEWDFGSPEVARGTGAIDLLPLRTVYLQRTERLITDAQDFFKKFVAPAARVEPPALDASTSLAQLIASDAFDGNKNLVIGAIPGSVASKQLLVTQMNALASKGFKHLYIEYLPADVFRLKLDKLNRGKSWRHIEQHLKAVDKALGFAENAEYSYVALVRKAQAMGVKIKALDASTSYLLDDALQMGDTPPTTVRDNSARNFYSHKAIEADALNEQDERWIALVDHSRLRTFKQTPGLADLQNAVALRVEDVGANQPVGLWIDTPGAIVGDPAARGDYRLSLHTAYKAPEAAFSGSAAPAAAVAHFSEYDIPSALRDSIRRQASARHGLDTRYFPQNPEHREAFQAFLDARTRLSADADTYLASHVVPARPDLSVLGSPNTPEALLESVRHSAFSGLVLGEGHSAQSSKSLLRAHMPKLKELEFKTLYVEHLLTDIHQADLDVFLRTQRLPDNLKHYLKQLDRGHMPSYTGSDTYTEVIQAAAKHGVRIRALDCTASYNIRGLGDADIARNRMFSYFASEVIKADQAAHGTHKWVAFVGSAHTNTHLEVPGLVQLQGAVSLHVRDTAPALAHTIRQGAWEAVADGISPYKRALRGDFILEVGVEGISPPAPFVPVDRSRLNRAGLYLIERPSASQTTVLHRSRSGEILSTPIKVDNNGLFYVERWEPMQGKRFSYENILVEALHAEVGLRPAP